MSPSPTVPTLSENAASMTTDQSQDRNDADQNNSPRGAPSHQNRPSSLLSQLLSPSEKSVDESGRLSRGPFDSLKAVAKAEERAGSDTGTDDPGNKHSSKISTMATAVSSVDFPSRKPASISTSGFSNHRQLLNNRRGRGTSLERTHKEKRVEELPKASFSTNPGDTAIVHPHSSTSTTPLSSISDAPPTEGVRAKYRLWRDTQAGTAVEKTWSIGEQGSDDAAEGQVEKSIAEALAGVEPNNNRSRKASHSVRLFREGLPEEKLKKREVKDGIRSKDKSPKVKEVLSPGHDYFSLANDIAGSSKIGNSSQQNQFNSSDRTNSTTTQSNTSLVIGTSFQRIGDDGGGYTESPQDYHPVSNDRPFPFPPQLLDDLRKIHNLTPAADKGLSFSGSLPVTESERRKSNEKRQENIESKTATVGKVADPKIVKDRSDEDEESEEEQISSALFVPHQKSHKSHESLERDTPEQENQHEKRSLEPYSEETEPEEWLVKHDVPQRTGDKSPAAIIVLKQQSPVIRDHGDNGYFPDSLSGVEPSLDAVSDAGYATKGEESSVTDDPEITPTDTPKGEHFMSKNQTEHLHRHQQAVETPLDAIELIPYRHQVGGHTTMWRFSKRAVCKQLNNRENEFYEKVERYHPKLLTFMPRYV
jgi:inositol-hexakisphosphate kinase